MRDLRFDTIDGIGYPFAPMDMQAHVRIPATWRQHAQNQSCVDVVPGTVESMMGELERRFPGLTPLLLDAEGRLWPFVNIYVNDEDIRFLENLATPIRPGDEVSIVPAIAGG